MNDVALIESLAAGGAGVTHLEDGMIAFVPRTAPGDRVRLRDLRRHRRHADARAAEIVAPGPGRTEPACVHYVKDNCGGCQWQHIAYEEQLAAKAAIVGNALRRIGHLDVPDPPVQASPRRLGYRTSITLTVRRATGGVVAGFHDAEHPDRVFMLESCAIARDEINALWRQTRLTLDALPRGDDVRLRLRVGRDGVCSVAVSSDGAYQDGGFLQVNEEVAALLREAVIAEARAHTRPEGRARQQHVLTDNVPLSPSGRAAAEPGLQSGCRALDLYAGSGDTALPLARAGCDVTMVELDARAVRDAEAASRREGVNLRCIQGRVEDHLGGLLPADVVIVNPPRTGLSDSVAARLRVGPSARLIYVSCDPATLARDLRRLGVAADRLTLRCYDMFPQTSHVETLAVVAAP